jgi:muramidase (phage lysozyme)
MNKPWEQYQMTETEWRQYEDEYADYLDTTRFQPTSLKDKIAIQNAIEQEEHNQRREAAINRIREMRRAVREQSELNH